MPGPALTFPMQLDPVNRRELEALLAQLNEGFLFVEHNEDGTHSDIHAHSITVTGTDVDDATFAGPVTLAQWLDLQPIEDAHDQASNSADAKGWTAPRILLGLVRGPNLNPASDVGIRLRGTAPTALIQPDWTISAGYDPIDALTALVVTHMDTSQSVAPRNIPLKVGFNAASASKFQILPDQVTESIDGVSLGSVDFGFGSNFHGFTSILGRTLYAGTPTGAVVLGSPTTLGLRLNIVNASGVNVLGVRLGDDSAYAQVQADIFRAKGTTGYIQSESTKFYFGQSLVTDILMRKLSSGTVAIRLGDDSDYGDLYARSLVLTGTLSVAGTFSAAVVVATSYMQSPVYILGTADTNGIRLKVESGYFSVREGDDSAYAPLLAQAIVSNGGYIQSASSYYYFGSGIAADLLMRKVGTGQMGLRLGDDSDYADLAVRFVHSTSSVQADTSYYIGPGTTSGALLKLVSGTPTLREGDDSDYNDLILRDLAATGTVSATGAISGASVSATGAIAGASVTATGTVSGATVTSSGTISAGGLITTSTSVGAAPGAAGTPSFYSTSNTDCGIGFLGSAADVLVYNNGIAGTQCLDKTGSAGYALVLTAGNFGAGSVAGCYVQIGNNLSNSSAAGTLRLTRLGGTVDSIWSDNSGLLRTSTAPPEEDGSPSDTSGTIVGTQSSSRAYKNILGERFDYQTALGVILDTPIYDFKYKDGRYQNEQFTGIVAEDSPVFAMDEGRSFNPVSAFGMLVLAMKGQQSQIESLKAEIEELKAIIKKLA